jgi:hypothetical protein
MHKFYLAIYAVSVLVLPFSMILDCLVSSNAGNETMIPSLGSPRAPFAGPPSIIIHADGVGWWYVGPDVLEDVAIMMVPEYQMPVRMCWRMSPLLNGARISNAGWFPQLPPFPLRGLVMGVGGRQLGPGCASKTL